MNATKLVGIARVAALAVGVAAVVATAQNPVPSAPAGEASQQPKLLTHGELAQRLVRKLGLYRFFSSNPTDLECMMLLSQNGIFPSATLTPTEQMPTPGWSLDPDKEVTLAEFAVVLVRALRLEGKVQGDPADPQNWLNVLKEANVTVDTIGAGIAAVPPISDVVPSASPFQITRHPIVRLYVPESLAAGVIDTIAFPDVRPSRVAPLPTPVPPPRPVTPVR